jgi:hypothetical protein
MYHRTIPMIVLAQVPVLVAQVTDEPVAVEISSFIDGGSTIFDLDVVFNPRVVKVKDRRKSDYVIGEQVSIFLRPDGTEDSERQHLRRHRMGSITIGKQESAYVFITEEQLEAELREAATAEMAARFGAEVS